MSRPKLLLLSLFSALLLLTSCSHVSPTTVTSAVVGPPPPAVAGPAGTLMVYTAAPKKQPAGAIEGFPVHSDYELRNRAGQELRVVRNRAGAFGDKPALVSLPVGNYQITAAAGKKHKPVTLEVVIVANQTTAVHLDGDKSWPVGVTDPEQQLVRLPTGEIIGWRATR